MRKTMILLVVILSLFPIISSETTITKQPNEIYNLGDSLTTTTKINALEDTEGFFTINLLCPGKETEVHKEYVSLSKGEEKIVSTNIPLTRNFIGESTGICKLKNIVNEESVLSDEFSVSDKINIDLEEKERNFEPEKTLVLEGEAKKENNENVEGFVNVQIKHQEESEEKFNINDTIKEGYFKIDYNLPEKTAAGDYDVNIKVYEKSSSGEITNKGETETEITIKQIPKSLEILFDEKEVIPGNKVKVKPKLYDQTGEKIPSESIITIKDSSNKIKTQETIETDKFLEYPIDYNEPADTWRVVAISNKITAKSEFEIVENEEADLKIINRTVIVQNKGNVPYNETVLINIGNETKSIDTYLEVDEEKKYTLTAPNGEYNIKIEAGGQEKLSDTVMLTGKAIGIEEASGGLVGIAKKPLSWILMLLLIAGIITLIILKRRKNNFFEKAPEKVPVKTTKKEKKQKEKTENKDLVLQNVKNTARISLSMQGNKHEADFICIKIKNIEEVKNNLPAIHETAEKLKKEAKHSKAFIYESNDCIFFLFSPEVTKTFSNEKIAIELSKKFAETLEIHNKKFKQKIDYGISLHNGEIISKHDLKTKTINFMPKGNLMNYMKKIAALSEGEVLISKEFRKKAGTIIKTEKHSSEEIEAHIVKEIKNREEHKKFIDSFLKRQKEEQETN